MSTSSSNREMDSEVEIAALRAELRRAEQEAESWQLRYRELFQNMHEGFAIHEIICDSQGNPCDYRFIEVNAAFQQLTGLSAEQILGKSVRDVLPNTERSWIEAYGRVALSGKPERFESFSAELGHWFEVYAFSPRKGQFATLFFDVTQRRQTEAALREANERFEDLVSTIPGMIYQSIGRTDGLETTFPYMSPQVNEILGCSPQEVMDNANIFWDAIHRDDWDRFVEVALKSVTTASPFLLEFRMHSRTGEIRWVRASSRPQLKPNGQIVYNGLMLDITDRKRAEEELARAHAQLEQRVADRTAQLVEANRALEAEIAERERAQKSLQAKELMLRKTLDLHERERQLLAYEIHDGFVQDVVGAKMHLEGLRHHVETRCEEYLDAFNGIMRLLANAVNEGRRMISEVRPLIIDEEGIIPGINFLIQSLRMEAGLEVTFEHPGDFPRLPTLLESCLFRIVQEALTNVKRHSGAMEARVMLRSLTNRLIQLDITDRGAGFDLSQVPEQRFGLKSIAERAHLFGGAATITSHPGDGTHVHVEIPVFEDLASNS